jgi:hypothetical protein
MATIIPSEVCALSNAREDAAMPCWTCAHPWTARQAAGMTATAWEAIKAQHKPNKAALGEPNAWTAQVSVAVTAWPIVAIVPRLPARSASFGARAFRLGTLPTTGIAFSPSRVGSCQATGMRRSAQGAPWALTRPSCGASTFSVAMAPCHGARLPGGPAVGRAGASPSRPRARPCHTEHPPGQRGDRRSTERLGRRRAVPGPATNVPGRDRLHPGRPRGPASAAAPPPPASGRTKGPPTSGAGRQGDGPGRREDCPRASAGGLPAHAVAARPAGPFSPGPLAAPRPATWCHVSDAACSEMPRWAACACSAAGPLGWTPSPTCPHRATPADNSHARVYCPSAVRANPASILSAWNRWSNTPRALTPIGLCSTNGSHPFPSCHRLRDHVGKLSV